MMKENSDVVKAKILDSTITIYAFDEYGEKFLFSELINMVDPLEGYIDEYIDEALEEEEGNELNGHDINKIAKNIIQLIEKDIMDVIEESLYNFRMCPEYFWED